MVSNLFTSRTAAAFLCVLLLATAAPAEESTNNSASTDQSSAAQNTGGSSASDGQTADAANTDAKNSLPINSNSEQKTSNTITGNDSSVVPAATKNPEEGKPETKSEPKTSSPHAQAETHKAQTESRPGSQPTKLYGRIEELCAGAGAKIPLKMQAMTPIRDASLDQKTLKGQTAATQSFPIDYRGTWSGELTVYTANFDKSYWEFDRAEADKESQLLRPGTRGRCTVTFYQGANNRTELQPCEVVFTTTVNASQEMKQMMGGASPFGALFGGGNNPMLANMQVPYMYALHLGNLTSGTGVTGNQLNSQLMKNTLKELARGVLEQEVVTRDMDRNPSTGKVKTGYSESVLRFTRMSNNRLYLQAASVSYRSDGKYQNKVILYGTLDRSSGGAAYGSPYGAQQANPFGGMMPGAGGGAGALQQELQQMQKLMQQMGGQ